MAKIKETVKPKEPVKKVKETVKPKAPVVEKKVEKPKGKKVKK